MESLLARAITGATGRSGRHAEGTLVIEAKTASVLDYESFIDGLAFLSRREHDRLKIAGGEILDNIVRHASPVEEGKVVVRAAKRSGGILLGFFFRSKAFASFASSCGDFVPLFDPGHHRWRGIGLLMCRNLARSVAFRPGEAMDRILLSFSLESESDAALGQELP